MTVITAEEKQKKDRMPMALYALAAGAFGIGTSEFVIMGLLLEVSQDLGVSIFLAGMLVTGYALGVVVGAPVLTLLGTKVPQKKMLLALMAIFTIGNLVCAVAPNYTIMMAARIITSLSHGAFFGIGSVVAASLVARDKKASAIALMFTGLTIANILGVPVGTWLGQAFGWRSTFWAITMIGPIAFIALAYLVPSNTSSTTIKISDEIKAVFKRPVLLGLLTTTLGFAGVFGTLTYIAPFLTQQTGMDESMISIMMVIFGAGLIAGNLAGGVFADRNIRRALYLTTAGLAASLILYSIFSASIPAIFVLTFIFGFAGFSTVPALQMDIVNKAKDGATLASASNIAAFNLGNALGAWACGLVVDHELGLHYIPLLSAGFAVAALGVIALNRPAKHI